MNLQVSILLAKTVMSLAGGDMFVGLFDGEGCSWRACESAQSCALQFGNDASSAYATKVPQDLLDAHSVHGLEVPCAVPSRC
jgi:hypothetical protein